jgi:predicted SnoaL-like aldol condensation-catalyzing enzyme
MEGYKMNKRDPKLTALLFNECINNQDLEGLVALMTNNHSLICYDHVDTDDRESSRAAWSSFFEEYPDYANHFARVESRGAFVVLVGHSTCSNHDGSNGPALWSARIEDNRLAEWQVYANNPENRRRLDIQ